MRLWTHSGGYVMFGKGFYEHRIIAAIKMGRPLRRGEVVHHINGIKDDNRPENLEVLSGHVEHALLHGELRRVTHCKSGHELNEANIYIRPDTGGRACAACRKFQNDKWNAALGERRRLARLARQRVA